MSEKKNNSLLSFVKRNLYYLVIGASLIIIATVIAIVLITNKPSDQARNSVNPNPATESTLPSESEKEPDSEQPKPSDSEKEPESHRGAYPGH